MPIRTRIASSSGHSAPARDCCASDAAADSVARAREADEERVSLDVYLVAAMPLERLPQQFAVEIKRLCVPPRA